ncbi:MAG: signal recognition particle-docking protein FtsY [Clostridia bacterium]|nr:signal recognition particle-docking protein FtsY [Clostridia bacterium]
MAFKDKFGKFFGFGNSAPQENEPVDEVNESVEAEDDASEDVIYSEPDDIQEPCIEEVTEDIEENSDEILQEEPNKEETEASKGFFAKLKSGLQKTRASINDKLDSVLKMFKKVDEELFEELEEALIMADVGVDTSLYIISELRKKVKEKKITESEDVKGEIEEIISEILCRGDNCLAIETSPSIIMVIGVNGVGKTTSIGKLAARLKSQGKKVILGAADTFRAAAIDQLAIWADRSGIDIIKHQEGSDPASVVFDTIAAAKARKSDVIILDTAGRLHNKKNLMDELNKISRVIERELPGSSKETLLVLDATTGQNAVTQAQLFCQSASITGIILTKLDGSAKGGIVLAISHEQNIPVKLIGVGEGIDDLQDFDSESFAKALFTE